MTATDHISSASKSDPERFIREKVEKEKIERGRVERLSSLRLVLSYARSRLAENITQNFLELEKFCEAGIASVQTARQCTGFYRNINKELVLLQKIIQQNLERERTRVYLLAQLGFDEKIPYFIALSLPNTLDAKEFKLFKPSLEELVLLVVGLSAGVSLGRICGSVIAIFSFPPILGSLVIGLCAVGIAVGVVRVRRRTALRSELRDYLRRVIHLNRGIWEREINASLRSAEETLLRAIHRQCR